MPRQKQLNSFTDKHIHFVGIGGCGMSGLARILKAQGAVCTGSDRTPSNITDALVREDINVSFEQTEQTLPNDTQLLVISAAISNDHPEVTAAKKRGVEIVKYAQMLGKLMPGRRSVAIAGTHGKSSTTSMLCHILLVAESDPSFIVGANCNQIGGGARCGQSDILIAEACEYDRSFHHFHPAFATILNVEADHLDCYPNLEAIVESFAKFAQQIAPDGFLLIGHDMPHRLQITADLNCNINTLGHNTHADWQITLKRNKATLTHNNTVVAEWTPNLPGEHMAYNAAAAAIIAHQLGVSWDTISDALSSFQGLDRRMQKLGQLKVPRGQAMVVDDYGHHPTEVDTTLRALRQHYKPNRLICVFQPHQHSRTRFLMKEFAASFSEADIVIIPRIYFVRDSEQERQAVTASDLVDHLREQGSHAMHLYPFDAIVEQLQLILRPRDLVVTMGAGDVWKVGQRLLATTNQ